MCGGPGCGKTLFALEFLVHGAARGQSGVFVTFEESEEDILKNAASLGYDVADLVKRKRLALEYIRVERSEIEETGDYDLEGLFIRLDHASRRFTTSPTGQPDRRAREPDAMLRTCLAVAFSVTVFGCSPGPQVTRVQTRPTAPTVTTDPGEYPLGLGTPRMLVVGTARDGTLYVPGTARAGTSMPLLILLHGGGGRADFFRFTFPIAEELGVVILALDARENTWDGIDSPYGPDVVFIDTALRHTFERVRIDPGKIALGGVSDGGAYALSLGMANGDLFTHLVAVAPGYFSPPAPPIGRPRIFVAHGTRDNVYNVAGSRNRIVPQLKADGYDVTYREFDGPHTVPPDTARQIMEWLTR